MIVASYFLQKHLSLGPFHDRQYPVQMQGRGQMQELPWGALHGLILQVTCKYMHKQLHNLNVGQEQGQVCPILCRPVS